MFLLFCSLQEYVQAEKKKNNKASSTKEGKMVSSTMQIDGKSTEVPGVCRIFIHMASKLLAIKQPNNFGFVMLTFFCHLFQN